MSPRRGKRKDKLPEAEAGAGAASTGGDGGASPSQPEAAAGAGPLARERGSGLTGFYLHLLPRLVRRRSASWRATLGLGLATLVALGLASVSGLLLLVYYIPSVERAHGSLQDLLAIVPYGGLLRNLHRWSAHAAVLFALLHLLRTLLWSAHLGAHRRVWLVGVGLLLLTLATSYSGYLLPWDQDAYWTVTVGTSLVSYLPLAGETLRDLLLGGPQVGQAALTRFFVLHVLALPALGLLLLVLHLFRLRRAGGLARPARASGPGEELIPASPLFTRAQLQLTLLVTLALFGLALGLQAYLGPAPDLLRPDNPPKAPWFLVGLQEVVSYSATFGGVLYPALLLALLTLAPWLDGRAQSEGQLLPGREQQLTAALALLTGAGAALAAICWWGDPQLGQASWLNPASIALLALAVLCFALWLLRRRRSLVVLAAVIGLLASLLVFTAVGWFWRGPDWSLSYHPGPGRGLQAAPLTLPPAAGEAP